jgi:hypothetical protein
MGAGLPTSKLARDDGEALRGPLAHKRTFERSGHSHGGRDAGKPRSWRTCSVVRVEGAASLRLPLARHPLRLGVPLLAGPSLVGIVIWRPRETYRVLVLPMRLYSAANAIMFNEAIAASSPRAGHLLSKSAENRRKSSACRMLRGPLHLS